MKKNCILFLIILISLTSFAQSSFDKALNDISSDLAEKLSTKGKKKVVVLYITDINKSTTVAGKYLADNISYNLVNDSRGFLVFDRVNLNEIAAAKNLVAEGYISADKVQELGKVLSVEVIIIGNYTVLSNTIKLTLKALDSNSGFVIAASMKDLPLNADAGALLSINVATNGGNNNSNRGFNGQPINSNEQINNPETVSRECETKNTGDFCFQNNTQIDLMIQFYKIGSPGQIVSIQSGQNQCFYDLEACAMSYWITGKGTSSTYWADTQKYNAQGNVKVEKCKSKTFVIK